MMLDSCTHMATVGVKALKSNVKRQSHEVSHSLDHGPLDH